MKPCPCSDLKSVYFVDSFDHVSFDGIYMGDWPLAVLLIALYFAGSRSQFLRTASLDSSTDCNLGLRENIDHIVLRGLVDTAEVNFSVWNNFINLVIANQSSDGFREEICSVSLSSCARRAVDSCYCVLVRDMEYQIIFNLTATAYYNKKLLKMIWSSRNEDLFMSGETWSTPHVYKVNSEVNTLQINEKNVSLMNSYCAFTPTRKFTNMQYCCSNAPSPCVSMIYFQGRVVIGSPCAKINLTLIPGIYSFSHSVCGLKSANIFSCSSVRHAYATRQNENKGFSFGWYKNVALLVGSVLAIALVVATVHRLDARMLFLFKSHHKNEIS